MSDIYELFRRVREHPDFVFGAIFTTGDVEPEAFDARQAEDRLTERGNELIELMEPEAGTRIVAEVEHERVIDGTTVRVVEIHWNGTAGLSFDVYADGECLTEDESLDAPPSNGVLLALLDTAREKREDSDG